MSEWEQLLAGHEAGDTEVEAPAVDISADPRSFRARVRAEVHMLLRALSMGDWEAVAEGLHPDPEPLPEGADDEAEAPPRWSTMDLEAAFTPYLEEWGAVAFDHRARQGQHTHFEKVGHHQWTVSQTLVAPLQLDDEGYRFKGQVAETEESGTGWTITGRIDLRGDTNPEGPLIRLMAVQG